MSQLLFFKRTNSYSPGNRLDEAIKKWLGTINHLLMKEPGPMLAHLKAIVAEENAKFPRCTPQEVSFSVASVRSTDWKGLPSLEAGRLIVHANKSINMLLFEFTLYYVQGTFKPEPLPTPAQAGKHLNFLYDL